MAIELQYLVWATALFLVQLLIHVLAAQTQVQLPVLAGNREDMPELTGIAGRARRAFFNMAESLLPFAILVLVAVIAAKTSANTALGAEIFFFGRLAYAAIYLAGIPWLRTLAWGVATAGMVMVLIPLL